MTLSSGLRLLACLRLDSAARAFQSSPAFKDDSEAQMLSGETFFWRASISEDKEELKRAISSLQDAADLAESQIRPGQPSRLQNLKRLVHLGPARTQVTDAHLTLHNSVTLAHTLLLQALLLFRTATAASYVSGALKLKSSWNLYQRLYVEHAQEAKLNKSPLRGQQTLSDKDRGDLLFGIGGFNFFLSLIPDNFKWIAEALGFKGDPSASQRQLQESIQLGGNRVYAAYLLLLWQDTFFFKNREKAEAIYQEATNRFDTPDCPAVLLHYLGGYLARVRGDLHIALERFERAQEGSVEVRPFQLMCLYEIGWCYWLNGDFQQSIDFFVPFLAEYRSPSYRAYCAYQLGCAFDHTGRKEEAIETMEKVAGYVRKHFTFDQYAARRARMYLARRGMSDFGRAIIPVHNKIEMKDFVGAMDLLRLAHCHVSPEALEVDSLDSLDDEVLAGPNERSSSWIGRVRTALDRRRSFKKRRIEDDNLETLEENNKDPITPKGASSVLQTTAEKALKSELKEPAMEESQKAAFDEKVGSKQGDKEPPNKVKIVDDNSAVYMFCLAQAWAGLKNDEEALACYKAVLAAERVIKDETYLVPYSYGGIGEIYLRKGDLVAAKNAFKVAKNGYSGYDFDKPLMRRVKHGLGQLRELERRQRPS